MKDPDGNCYWERKIVRDDGTEFLHIKTTLKDFQNKPLSSDALYSVIDTKDDASPSNVSAVTSSTIASDPQKKNRN